MRLLHTSCAVLLLAVAPAWAQVTVDLHALQALPPRASAPRPPAPRPPAAQQATARPEAAPQTATQAEKPDLPDAAPPPAGYTLLGTLPAGTAPPPPAPAPQAPTPAPAATRLRLAFAPTKSDLPPDADASIKQLAANAPTTETTTFTVLAYAPGTPDDPSTARRVSLARATAVRNALIAAGVPSARVVVRALGNGFGDGPPDRADIDVTADR
jgi:hypothetical protein